MQVDQREILKLFSSKKVIRLCVLYISIVAPCLQYVLLLLTQIRSTNIKNVLGEKYGVGTS